MEKPIGTATGLSEYAKKYLPLEEMEELLEALPSKVFDCDERNSMNEPLLRLETDNSTVHEIMLVIEK